MSALEEAIVELAPNDQWELRGSDLSGLVWFGPGPRPADAAIQARKNQIEGRPTPVVPLDAEELYDMLETKGTVGPTDRPRPKP